jgi:GT2 family glycosyltransferase
MNKVAIIILSWNSKKYLNTFFESLSKITYPRENIKFFIADSGSTDGTVDFIKSLGWSNIDFTRLDKNYGFTGGNNILMQKALDENFDDLVLLNVDTHVEPNFLDDLLKKANSRKSIGIVQSLLLHYEDPTKIQSVGNQLHYLGYGWSGGNWLKKENTDIEKLSKDLMVYASGAAVLYKADMLREIGLFDNNYFSYHEDSDISLRAQLTGWQVVLAPESIVYHAYDFPTDKNKIRYFWNEKNRLYLVKKIYTKKTLFLISPMMFFMGCGQLIFSLKNGFFKEWLRSRTWILSNSKKLRQARKDVQKTRKITDRELFKNITSVIEYQSVSNPLLEKIANPIMKRYWQIIKKLI